MRPFPGQGGGIRPVQERIAAALSSALPPCRLSTPWGPISGAVPGARKADMEAAAGSGRARAGRGRLWLCWWFPDIAVAQFRGWGAMAAITFGNFGLRQQLMQQRNGYGS